LQRLLASFGSASNTTGSTSTGTSGSTDVSSLWLGARLLASHMLEKGSIQRYSANANIIKILPLGRSGDKPSAAPTTPSAPTGLGLISSFWASPTPPAAASLSAGKGVTAEEAAALELQCHIASFERRMRELDAAMVDRELRAKKFLAQVTGTAGVSDRYKARALQQLRAKRILQQQYEVISNAVGRLEEVQMRCASNAIYADVVDALRTGNQILHRENEKGEALADEAGDIIAEFESLKMEGDAMSRELAGSDDVDDDLQEELRLLVEGAAAEAKVARAVADAVPTHALPARVVETAKAPAHATSTAAGTVAAAMPAAPTVSVTQEEQVTPPQKVRAGPFSS